MFIGEGYQLPSSLIIKYDGEVCQLANWESSVCWKCGQSGNIGDKCCHALSVLLESHASTDVGVRPSRAPVGKGGVCIVVPTPSSTTTASTSIGFIQAV